MKRKALGRGLSAILSEPFRETTEAPPIVSGLEQAVVHERLRDISVDLLRPNPHQPRTVFDDEALQSLSASIKVHGVIQPLVARQDPQEESCFELIAGERRLRASKLAGLTAVPVVILEAEELTALELALVENLQRADLDPIEEATAFRSLMSQFGLTQEEVATRVGKSRSAVANTLRLLHLSETIRELVAKGDLTAGHARCLLALEDPAAQAALAEEIVRRDLNVRQAEHLVQQSKSKPEVRKKAAKPEPPEKDIQVTDIERRLQQTLKTRVHLNRTSSGRGTLEIEFFDDAHLGAILRYLNVREDL